MYYYKGRIVLKPYTVNASIKGIELYCLCLHTLLEKLACCIVPRTAKRDCAPFFDAICGFDSGDEKMSNKINSLKFHKQTKLPKKSL